MTALTLKYRPTTFSDMSGQRLTAIVLGQMVANDNVPSALLFDGPRGTGKTSAARILATELNPTERDAILAGDSLSVIEIDAASNGSVADIRSLSDQLRFQVGTEHRVVILDEAHSITREGFNALLKTLEEPPAGVIFVLVTTEPQKLPDTILSRVMEFEFRRVTPEDILARLEHICAKEELTVDPYLLSKIAEVADGSVRDAVKNLDLVTRASVDTVEEFVELIGIKDVGPLMLASLWSNDHAKIFAVLEKLMQETGDARVVSDALSNTITDIFVLQAGGEVSSAGEALAVRQRLASTIPGENLYAAVRVLWDLKTRIRPSEDQRAALSMALVLAAEKVSYGKEVKSVIPAPVVDNHVPSVVEEPRPLSISDLQQMG